MKSILAIIVLLALVSPSMATPLSQSPDWRDSFYLFANLTRASWEGFMAEFHHQDVYELPAKCFGKDFANDIIEIVNIISAREEFILEIIEVVEKLGNMYELTQGNCDTDKIYQEISEQCSKVNCDVFSLVWRGEQNMPKLLSLYDDMNTWFSKHYADYEEARKGFLHVGSDWADAAEIILPMEQSS